MLLSALVFGLLGSFHCIGMCGPIAFMLPVDKEKPTKRFFQVLSYHLGRIFTYAIIGILFGILGKGFYLFGFQQQLSIIAGLTMILIVVFPKITKHNWLSKKMSFVILKVKSALGKELQKKKNDTFFVLGFLNGFLPCGLVYMAVLGALATPTITQASFYMILFGIGTIPLMTAFVYLGNFTKGSFRSYIQKAIPIVVVCIGILFVLRGLGLGIPFISPNLEMNVTSAVVTGCH
ncbi:MAG: sulfite exporter TauE/SafE family protein [Flavobacteriaceae bacterium]|nr:sulfite exporter TauE/SafE family protein [Flavobacteriaceae bacterium]